MLLDKPFECLTPTVDGDVLAVVAGADRFFSIQQIHQMIGGRSYGGVRNSVLRLAEQGIVTREEAGRGVVYALNRDHLLAPAVIEIARAKTTLLDRMRQSLAELNAGLVFAAMFGSGARGSMTAMSDLDVFAVHEEEADHDVWASSIGAWQIKVSKWTGNDVRVLDMSMRAAAQAMGHNDPVIIAIRAEGLPLAGPRNFWKELARGR